MTFDDGVKCITQALDLGYSASMDVNVLPKLFPPIAVYVKLTRQREAFSEWDIERLIKDFAETPYKVRYQSLRGHESFWLELRV